MCGPYDSTIGISFMELVQHHCFVSYVLWSKECTHALIEHEVTSRCSCSRPKCLLLSVGKHDCRVSKSCVAVLWGKVNVMLTQFGSNVYLCWLLTKLHHLLVLERFPVDLKVFKRKKQWKKYLVNIHQQLRHRAEVNWARVTDAISKYLKAHGSVCHFYRCKTRWTAIWFVSNGQLAS